MRGGSAALVGPFLVELAEHVEEALLWDTLHVDGGGAAVLAEEPSPYLRLCVVLFAQGHLTAGTLPQWRCGPKEPGRAAPDPVPKFHVLRLQACDAWYSATPQRGPRLPAVPVLQ